MTISATPTRQSHGSMLNTNGTWDSGETYTESQRQCAVGRGCAATAGVGASSEIVQYTIEYDWQMMILPFITNLPMFPHGPLLDNGGIVHFPIQDDRAK